MKSVSSFAKICPDSHKLQSKNIKNVIESIDDLPAIPATFMRIRETIKDPKSSVKELSTEVVKDPALTSKILKIANSAYYGFPRTISTVNDAIILMGFKKTWQLAMSVSMMNLFQKDSRIFNREVFWEHSVKVGICAQIIAKFFRYPRPLELYTMGLLHDIGKLILDQYFHDSFIKVIKIVKDNSISFAEAEDMVIGANHTIIGAWLLDRWKIPAFIVEGVAFHHAMLTNPVPKAALILALADNICIIKGIGISYDKNLKDINKRLITKLKLTERQVENIENLFEETAARITIKEG